MATLSSATLLSSNSSAANFRAWAKFISDVFALAWVNTADTGQIDFTTVAAPGAGNTSMGYKIYRMNDALQATKPVFAKIEFGSGGTATTPAYWITIGTGSDGAGNITGTILLARTQINGADGGATVQTNSYGSADTNRVAFAVHLTTANAALILGIERSKDATGADTNLALIVAYISFSAGVKKSAYLPFTTTLPTAQDGMHCVIAGTTPSALSGNVGVSPMIPMGYDAKQPGMNWMICLVNDFANFAVLNISIYGVSRVYQHLGAQVTTLRAGGGSGAVDANTRLCMRYE